VPTTTKGPQHSGPREGNRRNQFDGEERQRESLMRSDALGPSEGWRLSGVAPPVTVG
jgi:hypothetical protein